MPVDDDPFANPAPSTSPPSGGVSFVPVDHDPFAAFPDAPPASSTFGNGPRSVPVGHDPFAMFPDAPTPASSAANLPAGGSSPVSAQGLPPGTGFDPAPGYSDPASDPWWKRAGHYANDMVRRAADAVPILGDLANKADAATDAAVSGKSYGAALAAQHDEDAGFADQHPYSSLAASLAGAGGGTAAMLPAAGLGLGPSSTMAALGVDTAGLGGRMATAAVAQGALGGADAAVRGNDIATGAGIGALGGAAGPAIGAGVGGIARTVRGSNVPVPDALQGVPKKVVNWMQNGIGTATPEDMQAAADKLGPQGFFGEQTPGLLDLSQSVATNGGEGKGAIRGAYDNRFAGANDRVMAGVDGALGPVQDAGAVRQSVQDAGAAASTPYFARAAEGGQAWSPALEELSNRPAVSGAMGQAAETAANKGAPWSTITLDASGQPVGSDAAMQAYEAGQRPAVSDALAQLLGVDPSTGPLSAQSALEAQRKAAADPLYERFRGMSIEPTPELSELLQRPSMRNAVSAAQRKALDQGRTIFAPGAESPEAVPAFDREPFASGDPGEPPETGAPAPNTETVTAPPRPDMPRPQTLAQFVKAAGGVQDPGGDLKSMGLGHLIAKPGQRLGPDAMRQAAGQAGYLGGIVGGGTDEAAGFTTINDLYNALENGDRTFSVHDEDALHAWDGYDQARSAYEQGGGSSRADRAAGPRPPAPGMPDPGPEGMAPIPEPPPPRISGEGVDYIARAIGDNAGAAKAKGLNDDARIQTQLRGQFLDSLGQHPNADTATAYQAARQAFADPSRLIDALQAGGDAFGPNVSREALGRQFGELEPEAQPYFRSGAYHSAAEMLAKKPDGGSFVDAIAGNQSMRDKLGTLATSPEAAERFNAAMEQARQTFTEAQRPNAAGWADTLGQLDREAGGPRGGFGTAPGADVDPGVLAARDDLAAQLGQHPDFAKGRQLQGEYVGIGNAMDYGETAFRNTVHPNDVARDFGGMTPAEQEGAKVTARSDFDKTLRTNRNDFTALSRALQGPDGYNTAKIGTMFGDDAADHLTQLEAQERLQRENRQEVMGNSVTAGRQATKPLTEPSTNHGLLGLWSTLYNARPLDQPLSVLPKALTPEAIAERFAGNAYERYRAAAAPLLTRQGNDATELRQALHKLREQQALAAHGTEGVDSLVSALMAGLPQTGRSRPERDRARMPNAAEARYSLGGDRWHGYVSALLCGRGV